MTPMQLTHVLAPIDAGAAGIESAFLKAGDGLSEGLAMFESLNEGLKALSDELAGGATAAASGALDGLSRALVSISKTLPVDAGILRDLVDSNQAISTQFADLLDNMRMMTIISRSARIEAVVFDDERLGLESFARDIGRRTHDVQQDINACAAEHAKLTVTLKDIARKQFDLDMAFRDRLLVIASELNDAFDLIRRKREDTLAYMKDAASQSSRIMQAVGVALMSLQIGDTTRQRLEHVSQATQKAITLAGADAEEDATVPAGARTATAMGLCRLSDAQLRDTVICFDEETDSILAALRILGGETQGLVNIGQATFGKETGGSESFLSGFLSRFAAARDLIRTCEASRLTVEHAIGDFRRMLDDLNQTIATLTHTSLDLVLVGMNAGLKAARLGPEGRSFVVVADELKRLAGEISRHAESLRPILEQVQLISRRLDREEAKDATQTSDLDREIASIVDELGRGDHKIADLLRSMDQTGRKFQTKLSSASRDFEGAAAISEGLLHSAERLAAIVEQSAVAEEDLAAAAGFVDGIMMPSYSMARERAVHAQTVTHPAEPEEDARQAA